MTAPVPAVGGIGVWSRHFAVAPWADATALARNVEALGFGALWYPETPLGRDALVAGSLLLGCTDRITVSTGIASIWARDAVATEGAARALSEAYGARFLLGLGVSHAPAVARRGHRYARPYSAMTEFLTGLDEAAQAAERAASPRVLAALAPRMLALAAERAAGVLTYFVPPAHTALARRALGRSGTLAVEVAVVLESDPDVARSRAREHARSYLALENYRNNLRRLGYSDRDFDRDGSDRLVDDIVAWGDTESVTARISAHHAAGADHIAIQPLGSVEETADTLARVAPALLASVASAT
jgi:probable F420-dependent oxidoreductase